MMRLADKHDYRLLLELLLAPLRPYYSPHGALVRLAGAGTTYSRRTVEMEAFMRPLWGLVPFFAGGGQSEEWRARYLKGLKAGTDSMDSEYWGDFSDYDQKFVELAPLALSILLDPEMLFGKLEGPARDRLCAWLFHVNDYQFSRCNWLFFRILVNLALRKVGARYHQERLDEDLAAIDSWYVGSGWYQDGISGRHDYYVPFAMHFYGLILSVVAEDVLGARAERYKERAELFAPQFLAWFARTGEGLCYGRSLTYRFAQTAFWSAFLFAGCKGISISVIKGVINRNIRYFLSHDIALDSGVLSVGYLYPNLNMAERYNGPGSPYWALKTFLLLALPDNHPYWKCEEAPLPELAGIYFSSQADMLLIHDGMDATAFVPGMLGMRDLGRFTAKYDKFCYSTLFPFSVPIGYESLEDTAPDSMLSFVDDGVVRVRRGSQSFQISDKELVCEWSPGRGIQVKTTITPIAGGHKRVHVITTDREMDCYDAAFAVGFPALVTTNGVQASADEGWRGCWIASQSKGAVPLVVKASPNTNLGCRNTVIPLVRFHLEGGTTTLETTVHAWRKG